MHDCVQNTVHAVRLVKDFSFNILGGGGERGGMVLVVLLEEESVASCNLVRAVCHLDDLVINKHEAIIWLSPALGRCRVPL